MESRTYLTFLIGKEFFAVNVTKVLEVIQHQDITPIPKAPEQILGIINFRGEILPVIDTHLKFNLQTDNEVNRIIIVFEIAEEGTKRFIAATADSVKDVIEIDDNEIKPVPEMGIRYNSNYLAGVIRRSNEFILVLNVEKIFTTDELLVDVPQVETI